MTYRSNAKPPERTLVVRNHGRAHSLAVLAISTAFFVAAGFLIYLPIREPDFAGLLIGLVAMALTCLGVGGFTAYTAISGLRARTRLTIDGDRLVVKRFDGRRFELPLATVEGADVAISYSGNAPVYCTRINVAGTEPMFLDDTKSSAFGHYEETAQSIARFLGEGRS